MGVIEWFWVAVIFAMVISVINFGNPFIPFVLAWLVADDAVRTLWRRVRGITSPPSLQPPSSP
jgi:hypothetical protein